MILRRIAIATVVAAVLSNGQSVADELILVPDLAVGRSPGVDEPAEVLVSLVTSVVEDSEGSFYAADMRQSVVYRIDVTGKLVSRLGQGGEGPGDIMSMPQLAIRSGFLFVTGMGQRVDKLSTEWEYIESWDRVNPGSAPRSLTMNPDGGAIITAVDIVNQTVIDQYDDDFKHIRSFGDTYAVDEDIDWRAEATYAGGFADYHPDGSIYYVQYAPFEIRRYSGNGELLIRSREGGIEHVPPPPEPEFVGEQIKVSYPWGATGLKVLDRDRILVSCYNRDNDGRKTSWFGLFNSDLDLVGSSEMDIFKGLVGKGDGVVYLYCEQAGESWLERCVVKLE